MKIRSVEFAGTVVNPAADLPDDLPQVAFSGRSNVGKSSLINTILGRTRKHVARVSATPGKTQALNFFRVNDTFFLVDLPGFGFAKVPTSVKDGWKELVEGYLGRPDGALAVVHLMDVRRDPRDSDLQMLEYLAGMGKPALVVLTKVDKLNRSQRGRRIGSIIEELGLAEDQVVPFSSKTGEGREVLLEALAALLGVEEDDGEPAREPGAVPG